MKHNRASGILLHPTSLPGEYGIGDIGPQALRWIDFLAEAGCSLWQVLPLGPTGYGDSPYQSFSAFAGNPYIISPKLLLEEGLLKQEDLADMPDFPEDRVDFGPLIEWKVKLLDRAYQHFTAGAPSRLKQSYQDFWSKESAWLDDFGLFMAIKEDQGGISWSQWPLPLRQRQAGALREARMRLEDAIRRQIFRQWLFFRQWDELHSYAREKGILIIGDIPIFVAHDSADVWAHTELFFMDKNGKPTVVAGVPPDYFSPTGQLWGNPLYRWELHAETGYAWWLDRFRSVLRMVDIVRLDHFRGFAGYWEVPAGKLTAEIGKWVPGPGGAFFQHVRQALGDLPIIAEDLGLITPDVVEMRERFDLPGMKILQFGFASDPDDPFLPHNYPQNCVVYTGTHDNDTALGWFLTADEEEQGFCLRYLNLKDITKLPRTMVRSIWSSVAVFCLAPMQDILGLGPEARMNFPGRPSGNWGWRMQAVDANPQLEEEIKELNYLFSRMNTTEEKPEKEE
jgi:4-alpha-glucanotransferase